MKLKKLAAVFMTAAISMTAVFSVPALAAEDAAQEIQENIEAAAEEVSGNVEDLEQNVEDLAAEAEQNIEDLAAEVEQNVEDLTEAASDAVEEASENVEDVAEAFKDGTLAQAAEESIEDAAELIAGETEALTDEVEGTPFRDLMEKNLDESMEQFKANYDAYLEDLEQARNGSEGTISLSLADQGKSLIGMFLPLDLSWFESLGLDVNVSIKDAKEIVKMAANLNGTPVATLLEQVDFETLDIAMGLPELAEGFLTANYKEMLETAGEADQESLQMVIDMMGSVSKLLSGEMPDAETIEPLVRKYVGLVLDAYEEGGVSETTATLSDLSQDVRFVAGILTEQSALDMVKNILTEARDDEDLKGLIEEYMSNGEEDVYAQFQSAVDEILEDLADDEAGDSGNIEVDIITDTEDAPIGCALYFDEEEPAEDPLAIAYRLTDGEIAEALYELNLDELQLDVYSNTTIKDGAESGYAEVYFGETPVLDVNIVNWAVSEDGRKADVTLNLSVPEMEADNEDEIASILSGFSAFDIDLDLHGDGSTSEMDLTVNMSGSPLGTLHFDAAPGEGVEEFDLEGSTTYDMMDEEAMNTYTSSLDINNLISNLLSAGMPEEFLNTVFSMFGGAEE